MPLQLGQSTQLRLVSRIGLTMYFMSMVTTTVYLCGPIEHDAKPGDWRDWWTYKLSTIRDISNRNLISILNPLIKPHGMPKEAYLPQDEYWKMLNERKNVKDAFVGMNACIEMCRTMVTISDVILCRLPKIFTVGTIEELLLAKQLSKDVFFDCPDGIPSFWLLAEFAKHDTIDETFFLNPEKLLEAITGLARRRNACLV
jgi:hypothetical protein